MSDVKGAQGRNRGQVGRSGTFGMFGNKRSTRSPSPGFGTLGNLIPGRPGSQRELFEENPELLKEAEKEARAKGKQTIDEFQEYRIG